MQRKEIPPGSSELSALGTSQGDRKEQPVRWEEKPESWRFLDGSQGGTSRRREGVINRWLESASFSWCPEPAR